MFFVEKNRDTFYLEHKLDTLSHWFCFFEITIKIKICISLEIDLTKFTTVVSQIKITITSKDRPSQHGCSRSLSSIKISSRHI